VRQLTRLAAGSLIGLFGAAAAPAQPAAGPGEAFVRDPERPTNVLRTYAGDCRGDRYAIVVAPEASGPAGLRSLSVNRKGLAARQLARAGAGLPAGSNLMDAVIAGCGTGEVRIRLDFVEPHVPPVQLKAYSFTLDRRGRVLSVEAPR
jgi:hypothetical protein